MSKRTFGIAAVLASAVCFGFVPMLMKGVCAEGGNTLVGAFYRFLLSAPFVLAYLKIKGISLRVTKKEFAEICLVTVVGYGGTGILLFFSYNFIPTGLATTIHFVYPAMVILFGAVFLREKTSPVKVLCVAMCMTAVILFYGGGGGVNPLGILLAFVSGNTYAFYTVYLGRRPIGEMDPIKLLFYMNSISALLMLIVTLAAGQFTVALTPKGWIYALVFAVVVTFVGAGGYQVGIRYVGPQSAAILSTFEPITSIIVGRLLYSEAFTLRTAAGCVLILAATVIVAKTKDNVET